MKVYYFEASITKSIRLTWQYYDDGILLRDLGEQQTIPRHNEIEEVLAKHILKNIL